jgi:hypothetical protein
MQIGNERKREEKEEIQKDKSIAIFRLELHKEKT